MRPKTVIQICALILFLFACGVYASAQERCLSYDIDGVQLTGTVSKKTFPGPPNYESIRKGDQPETYWILHLAKPICTTASSDNDAESGLTDLQLIFLSQHEQFTRYLNKRAGHKSGGVMFVGKLTHAITGHHHTPVLMEVEAIGPLKPVRP